MATGTRAGNGNTRIIWRRRGYGEGQFINKCPCHFMETSQSSHNVSKRPDLIPLQNSRSDKDYKIQPEGDPNSSPAALNTRICECRLSPNSWNKYHCLNSTNSSSCVQGESSDKRAIINSLASCFDNYQQAWVRSHNLVRAGEKCKGKRVLKRYWEPEPKVFSLQDLAERGDVDDRVSTSGSDVNDGDGIHARDGVDCTLWRVRPGQNIYSKWPLTHSAAEKNTSHQNKELVRDSIDNSERYCDGKHISCVMNGNDTLLSEKEEDSSDGHFSQMYANGELDKRSKDFVSLKTVSIPVRVSNPSPDHRRISLLEKETTDEEKVCDESVEELEKCRTNSNKKGIVFGLLDIFGYRRLENRLKLKSKKKSKTRQSSRDYSLDRDNVTALISDNDASVSSRGEEKRKKTCARGEQWTDGSNEETGGLLNIASLDIEKEHDESLYEDKFAEQRRQTLINAYSKDKTQLSNKVIQENILCSPNSSSDIIEEDTGAKLELYPLTDPITTNIKKWEANDLVGGSKHNQSVLVIDGEVSYEVDSITASVAYYGDECNASLPITLDSNLTAHSGTERSPIAHSTVKQATTAVKPNPISQSNSASFSASLVTMPSGKVAKIGQQTKSACATSPSSVIGGDRTSAIDRPTGGSNNNCLSGGGGGRRQGSVTPIPTRNVQLAWSGTYSGIDETDASQPLIIKSSSIVGRRGGKAGDRGDDGVSDIDISAGVIGKSVAAVDSMGEEAAVSRQAGDKTQTYIGKIEKDGHGGKEEGNRADRMEDGVGAKTESEGYKIEPSSASSLVLEQRKIAESGLGLKALDRYVKQEGEAITLSTGANRNACFYIHNDSRVLNKGKGKDNNDSISKIEHANLASASPEALVDDRATVKSKINSTNTDEEILRDYDLKHGVPESAREGESSSFGIAQPGGHNSKGCEILSVREFTTSDSALLNSCKNGEKDYNSHQANLTNKYILQNDDCQQKIRHHQPRTQLPRLEKQNGCEKQGRQRFNEQNQPTVKFHLPDRESDRKGLELNDHSKVLNNSSNPTCALSYRREISSCLKPEAERECFVRQDRLTSPNSNHGGHIPPCLEMKEIGKRTSKLLYANQSVINTASTHISPNFATSPTVSNHDVSCQEHNLPIILGINPEDIKSNRLSHQYLNCSITGQNYPESLPHQQQQQAAFPDMIFTATSMRETSFSVKPGPKGTSPDTEFPTSPTPQDTINSTAKTEFSTSSDCNNSSVDSNKLQLLPSSSTATHHHYYNNKTIFSPMALGNSNGVACKPLSENMHVKDSNDPNPHLNHHQRYPAQSFSVGTPCSVNLQSQNSLESGILCTSDCCSSSCNNNGSWAALHGYPPLHGQNRNPEVRCHSSLGRSFSPIPQHLLQPQNNSTVSQFTTNPHNLPSEELQLLLHSHRHQQQQLHHIPPSSDPRYHQHQILLSSLVHRNSCPPMQYPPASRFGDSNLPHFNFINHSHHHQFNNNHQQPQHRPLHTSEEDDEDTDSLVQSVVCFKHRVRFSPVSLLWTFLSFLVAGSCLFSFLTPYWIIHPDHAHSFGLFNLCVTDPRYTLTRPICFNYGSRHFVTTKNPVTHARNGTLKHEQLLVLVETPSSANFGKIPSGAWQAACLLFGTGCCVQILGAILSAVVLALSDPWHRKLALANGYLQAIGDEESRPDANKKWDPFDVDIDDPFDVDKYRTRSRSTSNSVNAANYEDSRDSSNDSCGVMDYDDSDDYVPDSDTDCDSIEIPLHGKLQLRENAECVPECEGASLLQRAVQSKTNHEIPKTVEVQPTHVDVSVGEGVILLVFGLLIYPAGFVSPFFSYYCESSGAYSTGHCSLGWSYVIAIMTSSLSIFCPVMSNFSESPHRTSIKKVGSHSSSSALDA